MKPSSLLPVFHSTQNPHAHRVLSTSHKFSVCFVWALAGLSLLSGCDNISHEPNSGTAKEVTSILGEVQQKVDAMKTAQDAMIDTQKQQVTNDQKTMQLVSDSVYGAQYTNQQNPQQNEHTALVDKNLSSAAKSLPPASAEGQRQAIENLQLALSKSESDRAILEARFNQLNTEAEQLRGQAAALKEQVDQRQSKLDDASHQLDDKVGKLKDADATIRIKAAESEEARRQAQQEAAQHTRLRAATVFMVLGGLFIAGAVIATFLHVPGVLWPGIAAGAGMFGLGWAITYVEDLLQNPWFRYGLGGVALGSLGIGGWILYRAYATRRKSALDAKISTNMIGAVQDVRNDDTKTGTKVFAAIKPYLEEWHVDANGNPDHNLMDEIEKRLVAMNLKNPSFTHA